MKNKVCVAYMRYSTDNQDENSIEYQRAANVAYCLQKGLMLQEEFVDKACSASNDRRPSFQRMIEASKNCPGWDTILVYDFSRLFRNYVDAARYKTELSDRGITVISVKENIPNSAIGWFMEAFTDVINAFYVQQTREKTFAGMAEKAKQAIHCGGVPPLGYKVGNGKYYIEDAEADVVREIFRMFDVGTSYAKMVNTLKSEGAKTKSGRDFTKNSFYDILTQEKYIGIFRWNKRKAKNSKGQYNNHAYKPLEEQIIIPGGCPAIIPLELFQAVQKKLSERKQGRADTKSRHHYMLGGLKLMRCSVCGSYMVGRVTISHGKRYITYACPRHKGGGCPTKDIRAEELEEYVTDAAVNNLVTECSISQLNELAREGNGRERQIQNQLTGINKRIDNLVKNLETTFSKSLSERLCQLERDRDNLTSRLEEATADIPCITEGNLEQFKENLSNHLRYSDDPEVKQALKTYVGEILVSNEDVKVTLQL